MKVNNNAKPIKKKADETDLVLDEVYRLVGLRKVKQEITKIAESVNFQRLRKANGFAVGDNLLNMIFSGHPGTGKNTIAGLLGELLKSLGILKNGAVLHCDARTLIGDDAEMQQKILQGLFKSASGNLLFIDSVGDIFTPEKPDSPQMNGLMMLINAIYSSNDDFVAILCDESDEIEPLLSSIPALKTVFPIQLFFEDYSAAELMEIARKKLEVLQYRFSPSAEKKFLKMLESEIASKNVDFTNGSFIDDRLKVITDKLSIRVMHNPSGTYKREDLMLIIGDDIDIPVVSKALDDDKAIKVAIKELHAMVGQPKIKRQIEDFVGLVRHYNSEGVDVKSKVSLQWVFTGNNGLGKGSFAGIIGKLYKAMGILPLGHVVEFKVEKLIGLNEDEAIKMLGNALEKSVGGILFFDGDSPKVESVPGLKDRLKAILVNLVGENQNSSIVFYAEPKQVVMDVNGDAEHSFELMNVLEFENYSQDELLKIFVKGLAKENMKPTPDAKKFLSSFIQLIFKSQVRTDNGARIVRMAKDQVVKSCLQRLSHNGKSEASSVMSVTKADVAFCTEEFISTVMGERKKLGF